MFSFFLFLFFSYLIYRSLIPKRVFSRKRTQNSNSSRVNDSTPPMSSSDQKMIVVDEMKKCPTCGTFNPKSHALEVRGKYYCEKKCLK